MKPDEIHTIGWHGAHVQNAESRLPLKTRVMMSSEGLSQFPRYKGRQGTVVGHSRKGLPRISWDGLRYEITYAPWFIERAPTNAP